MRFARLALVVAALVAAIVPARAASPDSGTLVPGATLRWNGDSYAFAQNQEAECDEPVHPCDVYTLTVNTPRNYWKGRAGGVRIEIGGFDALSDFDLYVYARGQGEGPSRMWTSLNGAGAPDSVVVPSAAGTYFVVVIPYQVVNGTFAASARFVTRPVKPPIVRVPAVGGSKLTESGVYPSLAFHPGKPERAIAAFTSEGAMIRTSGDGGRTWRGAGMLPGYDSNPFEQSSQRPYAPVLAVDGAGGAYAAVVTGAEDGYRINVHRSADGGAVWSRPTEVHYAPTHSVFEFVDVAFIYGHAEPMFIGRPRIAASGTTVAACWAEAVQPVPVYAGVATMLGPSTPGIPRPESQVHILVARSIDGGSQWTTSVVGTVPQPDHRIPAGVRASTCDLAVAPDGGVHVAWIDGASGSVAVASAADGGRFAAPVAIAPHKRPTEVNGLPSAPYTEASIAAGPARSLAVAWHDAASGDLDVLVARSSDGGATWGAPQNVGGGPKGRDQLCPRVAITPKGQVDVVFYDRRNDAANYWFDTYLARSSGSRWNATRLSSQMFGGVTRTADFDYVVVHTPAIAASDTHTAVAWADSRTKSDGAAIWAAKVPNTRAYGGPNAR